MIGFVAMPPVRLELRWSPTVQQFAKAAIMRNGSSPRVHPSDGVRGAERVSERAIRVNHAVPEIHRAMPAARVKPQVRGVGRVFGTHRPIRDDVGVVRCALPEAAVGPVRVVVLDVLVEEMLRLLVVPDKGGRTVRDVRCRPSVPRTRSRPAYTVGCE